jgi:polyisoprenoid-binding protein YceI
MLRKSNRFHAPRAIGAAVLGAAALLAFGAAPATAQDTGRIRLVVAPAGNEVRYRVREQLASIDFPSDAVGTTSSVEGELVLEADGRVVRDSSRFVIDLGSMTTDSERRDNYVRRNTLETETNPSAVFVPTALQGLVFPLPTMGDVAFRLVGDLTIKGVTKPVTWDVTAHVMNGSVAGEAKTAFTFDDFELTKPRVRSVLTVNDDIRLEYTFRLVPATQ